MIYHAESSEIYYCIPLSVCLNTLYSLRYALVLKNKFYEGLSRAFDGGWIYSSLPNINIIGVHSG